MQRDCEGEMIHFVREVVGGGHAWPFLYLATGPQCTIVEAGARKKAGGGEWMEVNGKKEKGGIKCRWLLGTIDKPANWRIHTHRDP
jgi:hypothetical protein